MNPQTLLEARTLVAVTKKAALKSPSTTVIIAPPTPFLGVLSQGKAGVGILWAAQHIHEEESGSYTGDISAMQVKSAGATHVIIGHAERRARGETNDLVQKKVARAFASGLTPIVCVGENTRDHSGEYLDVVRTQILAALGILNRKQLKQVVIAYEPVWAIGAKDPMRAHDMHEMSIFIRKVLWEKFGKPRVSIPVLYGGAILGGEHVQTMLHESEVDGFLIGRASVDPEKIPALFEALHA